MLTDALLEEHLALIAAAAAAASPGGVVPPGDPLARLLAAGTVWAGGSGEDTPLSAEGASLYGPGAKQLPPAGLLSALTGRNEKTRVTLRLVAGGEAAPGREAAVPSAEEQAGMLAFYRRKTGEAEALARAEASVSDESPWADGRALKATLAGVGALRLR